MLVGVGSMDKDYYYENYGELSDVGISQIVSGILNILAHVSLMYGALKHNPTTLMVYLVSASLTTILEIVVLVLPLPFIGLMKVGPYWDIHFQLGKISTFVNAYSLIWGFHFYKEVKSGAVNNWPVNNRPLIELPYFSKCCSGSPLLTGSIYLAVIGMICGIMLVGVGSMDKDYYYENYGELSDVGISQIVSGILNILAHVSLMYGALKHNPTTLMVYLVSASLTTILEIVVLVLPLPFIGLMKVGPYWDIHFQLGKISTFVNAYSLIWGFHFYKEVKSGAVNNAQQA